MKRYIFALLLLLLAANATAEGKVGVRVEIEDTAALEKGEATDVRLYCYYKPQMSPPKLEFSGSVHYLGEKKVNGEYVYHYRISPRSTGSLALNFQFYNDEAAETLARVDVWETKRPGGTEVAMPESPYAAGAKGIEGMEGIGEPGIGSYPSDLTSKIFSLTVIVISILFLIKKLVRGAEKKILHAYYGMASPLLRKEAYGNAPDYSRLLERMSDSRAELPVWKKALYYFPYFAFPMAWFAGEIFLWGPGLFFYVFHPSDLLPLIYLFVGWAVLMPVFLLINRAIFGIFEISDTKALDGSPIIFFSIIIGTVLTTLAATPLLNSLVIVAVVAGNLLRGARLACYRMDSPCPEMAVEEQIDRLAQQFSWKVKEREPGRLVAAPERSRLVRIHVECDGQGFHVAAFHLLNPLAPAPMRLLAEIQDAVAQLKPKDA